MKFMKCLHFDHGHFIECSLISEHLRIAKCSSNISRQAFWRTNGRVSSEEYHLIRNVYRNNSNGPLMYSNRMRITDEFAVGGYTIRSGLASANFKLTTVGRRIAIFVLFRLIHLERERERARRAAAATLRHTASNVVLYLEVRQVPLGAIRREVRSLHPND